MFTACVALLTQCAPDGEYEHPIVYDNIPDVPVLFPGATSFGGNPYYQISFGTGGAAGTTAFTINVSVPNDAPLKIKEISKMIAGTTSITPGQVATATNYLPGVIAVNGTSATIISSLTEFNAKVATASRVTQANVDNAASTTPATPYVERAFLLLVTLEDGSTIISEQVRLRVTK